MAISERHGRLTQDTVDAVSEQLLAMEPFPGLQLPARFIEAWHETPVMTFTELPAGHLPERIREFVVMHVGVSADPMTSYVIRRDAASVLKKLLAG